MRKLVLLAGFLLAWSASAATIEIAVVRNGFEGPVAIAIASRVEGQPPRWSAEKTLPAGASTLTLPALDAGMYVVLARGPEPLQRLSAKVNAGAGTTKLRLVLPKSRAALRVTLAGAPLAGAIVSLVQDELRWTTELVTDGAGRFEGSLWMPDDYAASIRAHRSDAPHVTRIAMSAKPVAIDVPDRHVAGRVVTDDGKPVAGAAVALQTETGDAKLSVRTTSAGDGTYRFFGVREGSHALSARAPSYLHSDALHFSLSSPAAQHAADLVLTRGQPREVRVIDTHSAAVADATLLAACAGQLKSSATTDADGRANVALPASGSCVLYAVPPQGSIAIHAVEKHEPLVIRVPPGSSSLRMALKSEAGDAFPDLRLLMRINGAAVPPAVSRQLASRGFSLVTGDDGSISLPHIPPGTYEFWPYRTDAEGQMIYEVGPDIAAPIVVNVLTGENNATVRLRARR